MNIDGQDNHIQAQEKAPIWISAQMNAFGALDHGQKFIQILFGLLVAVA